MDWMKWIGRKCLGRKVVGRKLGAQIRHTFVRETGISWHHGDLIKGPPETRRTSQHYSIEGRPEWGLQYGTFTVYY